MKDLIESLNFISYLSFPLQFFYWFIFSVFSWIYNRCFIGGLISFYYNNSARKKLKKEQSFKEWLFFSKFKRIPKFVIVIYIIVTFIHIVVLLLFLVFRFVGYFKVSSWIVFFTSFFDGVFYVAISLLFWTKDGSFPYGRWFKK